MTTNYEKDLEKTLRETKRLQKEIERDKKRTERDRKEARKREALSLTEKAVKASNECYGMLYSRIREPIVVDWESLKQHNPFTKEAPRTIPIGPAPDRQNLSYNVVLSVWDRLSTKRRDARTAEAAARFEEDTRRWREHESSIQAQNEQAAREYHGEREKFVGEQDEHNRLVESQKEAYLALDREGVVHYCDLVLSRSSYPKWMPAEYDIDYVPSTKMLSIDRWLPTTDELPAVEEVKYIATRDAMDYTYFQSRERRPLYENVLSEVVLRTLWELSVTDVANALDSIALHGWVRSFDRSTRLDVDTCVASIEVEKKKFMEIDLPRVIPWVCFTSLGGVESARPRGVSPIKTILRADREDR